MAGLEITVQVSQTGLFKNFLFLAKHFGKFCLLEHNLGEQYIYDGYVEFFLVRILNFDKAKAFFFFNKLKTRYRSQEKTV